ncbi:hypothetical protein PQX77_007937 [Marasmius sp. AFHP31]|nr:hypothetical protein PQX77_007937 [Marasmius sp. AFHP31]
MLGPVLLHNRFKKRVYYDHFIRLVQLFNVCFALSVSRDKVDGYLRQGFANWVSTYERLYYQYTPDRLPTCTLPIHALLHLADEILRAGPVWCHWNFPTERFCGALVRSSKSRKNPYASFARRLLEVACLNQIKVIYDLKDELDLSDARDEAEFGHSVPQSICNGLN